LGRWYRVGEAGRERRNGGVRGAGEKNLIWNNS
jgi:hypothetical protein